MKKLLTMFFVVLALTTAAFASDDISALKSMDIMKDAPVDMSLVREAPLTMFNVWGTFCGPCIHELPVLGKLAHEYKGKMQIIGVVLDWYDRSGNLDPRRISMAESIVEKTGADYMHILLTPEMNTLFGNISGVPATFFVTPDGRIVDSVIGANSEGGWRSVINGVLEKIGR